MEIVILYTIVMMGIAFAIGFIVAYLIKIVTHILYTFQEFSLSQLLEARKRLHKINIIRGLRAKEIALKLQKQLQVDILDHFYALKEQKKQDVEYTNELVDHFYGSEATDDKLKETNEEGNLLTNYYYGRA